MPHSDYLTVERRDDVAVVWLDERDRPVNTLNAAMLDALEAAIEEAAQDAAVRAGVIISRKPHGFVAGADLDMLAAVATPEDASRLSRRGHRMIRRVAELGKPLVAAIHGPALGGGLELALACTYRVASSEPPTRFALPEVMLGLLPGGGGTQMLPRLVGLQQALAMMLTGKNVFPYQARKMGLVDLLTHRHNLLHAAVSAARDLASGALAIDRSKTLADRMLEATPLGRRVIYQKAAQQVEKETGGHYPAPPLILECVRIGREEGIERGFEAEARHFGHLVCTPEHRALVGIFRAKQRGDKNPFSGARRVRTIGILGGGLMGSGIAEVSAVNGLEVRIKDADLEAAAKSRQSIFKSLQRKVRRRQITRFEADTILERVVPVEGYARLAHAEIVIEAVPEDLELKRQVLAEVEAVTGDETVFATNTSSIPISEIAAGARRPERVVGMHYFSPVPQRPLLEVIRKDDTPEEVLATVCEVGLRQGRTLVVVRDGPGFYTTRILAIYLNEAALLFDEGADVEAIDAAMRRWGFPMGPFALMDLVGLDVGAKVTPVLTERMQGRDLPTSDLAARLVRAGLLGQKTNLGFYSYEEKKGRPVRKGLYQNVYEHAASAERRRLDSGHIQDRLGLLMVNEALRCLEEGILSEPSDGDLAAVFGLGFPPFRGGPFRYVDLAGAPAIADRLDRLAEHYGARFRPSGLLREHAASGRRFFG